MEQTSLSPETRQWVDAYWAAVLGCTPDDFYTDRVLVVEHGPARFHGASVFARERSCIVSVPPTMIQPVRTLLGTRSPAEVFDRGVVAQTFRKVTQHLSGPDWIGIVDRGTWVAADPRGTRPLTALDASAVSRLAATCAPGEWEQSRVSWGRHPVFGCFAGEELAAAGTVIGMGERLQQIGVVVHPEYRGKGFGRAVASVMTEAAFEAGAVVLCRAPADHKPALGLARSVGFREYARLLVARFIDR